MKLALLYALTKKMAPIPVLSEDDERDILDHRNVVKRVEFTNSDGDTSTARIGDIIWKRLFTYQEKLDRMIHCTSCNSHPWRTKFRNRRGNTIAIQLEKREEKKIIVVYNFNTGVDLLLIGEALWGKMKEQFSALYYSRLLNKFELKFGIKAFAVLLKPFLNETVKLLCPQCRSRSFDLLAFHSCITSTRDLENECFEQCARRITEQLYVRYVQQLAKDMLVHVRPHLLFCTITKTHLEDVRYYCTEKIAISNLIDGNVLMH